MNDWLDALRQLSVKTWGKFPTVHDAQQYSQELWDRVTAETGVKFRPLYPVKPGETPTAAVLGSGSFSTGELELWESRINSRLERDVIKYVGTITDKTLSKAKEKADSFIKPDKWQNN